jgi:1,2-diacylglycerol 3-alpha-glucosyltransferase
MKIAYVIDQYDNQNNGTSVSAYRFAHYLRARGHDVRIVATGKQAPDKFVVPTRNFGPLNPIFRIHGMAFGKPDKAALEKALEGVDVVHMFLPFRLCRGARKTAKRMGVPHMAAFHCQPENITYNIGLKRLPIAAHLLYLSFKQRFYRYVRDIHCPSRFIADQLKKHGYSSRLHVISNGVDEAFGPMDIPKPMEWEGKFVILMVGRLAAEKRQDLVIKAAMKSRYADRIQLVFLGRGPKQKRYERLGRGLKNRPVFKYVSQEEIVRIYNQCDLYVHAAEAEIEAIVCLEAIASGLVPVIANSSKSAARQFALDDRSLFKNKDASDLASKIDYWIEHPEERSLMRDKYLHEADDYRIEKSIDRIEEVYARVISEQHTTEPDPQDQNAHIFHMPTPFVYRVDERYRFINRNILFRLGSSLLFYVIAIPLLSLVSRLFFGLKIVGKKNMRYLKGGAVTVTNHVLLLDSPMVACTLFPRRPFFATLKSNFEIPVVRHLVRLLGGVPIPESPKALHAFMESMRVELEKGRIVHFYPEASLWPWYDELRPFRNGAFQLAVKSGVPVLPMVFTFRKPGWLMSLLRKKPLVTLHIGTPEYPALTGTERSRVIQMRSAVHETMAAILASEKRTAS